ncbi:hypothetical protein [Mesorhizobium sp. M0220]|uniref:hypothetical protein n=1 Tax=Mesorhizobium sp. M0220 TaxID=2956920 RepID=UPI003335879E
MIEGADRALDRWNQNQTREVREASIASYIETGEIDHAAAGIDELEVSIVQAAAAVQIERQVLKPVGLSMDGTVGNSVREAMMMERRESSHGY